MNERKDNFTHLLTSDNIFTSSLMLTEYAMGMPGTEMNGFQGSEVTARISFNSSLVVKGNIRTNHLKTKKLTTLLEVTQLVLLEYLCLPVKGQPVLLEFHHERLQTLSKFTLPHTGQDQPSVLLMGTTQLGIFLLKKSFCECMIVWGALFGKICMPQ